MKRFLMSLTFGLACVPIYAQPLSGSRALSRAEVSQQTWPSLSRLDFQVSALQLLLRNSGFYRGKPDGVFGLASKRAVRAFQRSRGLRVDGVVGGQTWSRLCPRLKRGDRGDAVRALQTLLNSNTNQDGDALYGRLAVDGNFGFSTEKALRKYQSDYELKADGVVGAQSWASLLTPDESGD